MATLRFNIDARKLTLAAVGIAGVTLATCWLLAVMRMRSDKTFLPDQAVPSLSQTADEEPGRTIFAMGLTISAMLFLCAAYLRFVLVAVLMRSSPALSRFSSTNLVSLVCAFAYALTLTLVACFDSRDFFTEHVDFSYAFFISATLYNAVATFLDWHLVWPSLARIRTRDELPTPLLSRKLAKVALTTSCTLTALVLLILILTKADYSVAAVFEWLTMAQLLVFWVALSNDFAVLSVSLTSRLGPQGAETGGASGRVVQLP